MPVIVIAAEEERHGALKEDDPKRAISEAWLLFLDFHRRSAVLVRTGMTARCVGVRAEAPEGVDGPLLYPRFECCGPHQDLGRRREKIVALLGEHGLNVAILSSQTALSPVSYDPLTQGWWAHHGFEWSHETPIVKTADEVPES